MRSSVSPKDPTSHLILNCQTEAAEPEETERKSKMNIPPTRKATGEAHHIGRSYLQWKQTYGLRSELGNIPWSNRAQPGHKDLPKLFIQVEMGWSYWNSFWHSYFTTGSVNQESSYREDWWTPKGFGEVENPCLVCIKTIYTKTLVKKVNALKREDTDTQKKRHER